MKGRATRPPRLSESGQKRYHKFSLLTFQFGFAGLGFVDNPCFQKSSMLSKAVFCEYNPYPYVQL